MNGRNEVNRLSFKEFIKKIIMSMMILCMCISSAGCEYSDSEKILSEKEHSNDVLMTIDDYDITAAEYNMYLIQYLAMLQPKADELTDEKCQEIKITVVEQMRMEIIEYLLSQVTEGVEPSDEDFGNIDKSVEAYNNTYGKEWLNSYGIDDEMLKELFTKQIYIYMLLLKKERQIWQLINTRSIRRNIRIKRYKQYIILSFQHQK